MFISGGPASGKTTLAPSLAANLNLPAVELDGLLLESQARGESFNEGYEKIPTMIASMDSWVVEGAYLEWVDPLLHEAELIVWIDVPWRVASYRIITRHVKATIARNNRFPGWRRLSRFWLNSRRYYKDQDQPGFNPYGLPKTRSTAARYLTPFGQKVVMCRTRAEAERIVTARN